MGNKGNEGSSGYLRRLRFVPDADRSGGNIHRIYDDSWHDDMPQALKDYYDHDIESIRICKHSINPFNPIDPLVFHAFVVFETRTRWWSIEKNSTEVLLQCSYDIEYVRKKIQRNKRHLIISDWFISEGNFL